MSASVSFCADAIFGTCESLGSPRRSMTLRSASTFYTSTIRLTCLKLLMCLYLRTQTFEPHVLQLFWWDFFIILSRFLAGFCSVEMSQAFQYSIPNEKGYVGKHV